jgi:hypothetical protein
MTEIARTWDLEQLLKLVFLQLKLQPGLMGAVFLPIAVKNQPSMFILKGNLSICLTS